MLKKRLRKTYNYFFMKSIALSSLMMLCSFFAFSQSFEVKNVGTQYSLSQIETAFANANFCGSYFTDKRNILVLNDGSIVELLSKEELNNNGFPIGESCFLNSNEVYYQAQWSITPEGHLLKGMNAYTSEKEYKHYNTEN